jgi:hypothetical protein
MICNISPWTLKLNREVSYISTYYLYPSLCSELQKLLLEDCTEILCKKSSRITMYVYMQDWTIKPNCM